MNNLLIGIESMMKKGTFIELLFLFQDILIKINISSNQLQSKKATLGNSVNLINGVIRTFETDRCTDKFKIIWKNIKEFANNLNISLDISKSIFYKQVCFIFKFKYLYIKVQSVKRNSQ